MYGEDMGNHSDQNQLSLTHSDFSRIFFDNQTSNGLTRHSGDGTLRDIATWFFGAEKPDKKFSTAVDLPGVGRKHIYIWITQEVRING